MKKFFNRLAAAALLLYLLPLGADAAEFLVPVGQVVGLELGSDTVTVAAFDDALGAAARDAGLKIGDEILALDGTPIRSAEDLRDALNHSDGSVKLAIRRGGKACSLRMEPEITADGPKLGVYLRQGVTGIGTVTWYDPETGNFGALGHGVSSQSGELVEMTEGNAYPAGILSVKKGKVGEPGQLKGAVRAAQPIGTLAKNTEKGIFGSAGDGWEGDAVPVAEDGQVHPGSAVIRSTVAGDQVQEYAVEIVKVYSGDREDGRNLLLKVTDAALLSTTGGIVQGMSGSPILQDGVLVGAVTHVLVNDPTTGYGITIGNMLAAAK